MRLDPVLDRVILGESIPSFLGLDELVGSITVVVELLVSILGLVKSIGTTLGDAAVLNVVAVASSWKHKIFCIALMAMLKSVPCCKKGKLLGGLERTSCKSCKIIVSRSMGVTCGSAQCVGKNSTVLDVRFCFVSLM